MNEERIMIEAIDSIVSTAVKNENRRLLGLTDVLIGGGGAVTGFPGAGFGMMAAIRAGQQPFTLTNLGSLIDRMYKLTPSAATGETAMRAATGVATGSGGGR
jgi:hypothetical protein